MMQIIFSIFAFDLVIRLFACTQKALSNTILTWFANDGDFIFGKKVHLNFIDHFNLRRKSIVFLSRVLPGRILGKPEDSFNNESTEDMKFYFILFMLSSLFVGQANGQGLNPNDKKSITFLCPPCNLPCDTVHFDKPGFCPVCRMKLYASYPEFANKLGEHGDVCRKKVAVLLFPGVEIIDFSGPWEVFGAAGMEVFSVASSDTLLTASMGLTIKPDFTFTDAPQPDIILVPGGAVNPSDTAVVNWIVRSSRKSAHTMSVCTGAFFLAAGGLLNNQKATTNFPALEALRQWSPTTIVVDKVRFVDNGHIITSAGLSSGIDAAFHLVSLYIGKAQTAKLAIELEYGWHDDDPFVRGQLADRHVRDFLDALTPFDYEMTDYSGDKGKWSVSVNVKTTLKKDDLLQILTTQFEQVSGWKKERKGKMWVFSDSDEHWQGMLDYRPEGLNEYFLTLTIFKK